jgi:hypothetical protein
MSYQSNLIQPFTVGQETDVEPHIIPDSAFEYLRNMHLYRGRLKRKFGYTNLGRLQIVLTAQALGNTGASPFAANIFAVLGLAGSIIPGTVTIRIAAPVGPLVYVEPATPNGTLDAGGGNTGTINYATGAISLIHGAGAASAVTIDFTYAKCLPVMGLPNRELIALNFEELLAFDTRDAFLWNTATNRFNLITPAAGGWTGSDSDFFWSCNYWKIGNNNLLWVSNNVANDRIRYYAGGGAAGWTTIVPELNAGNTRRLYTCLLMFAYRNRLICLNTQEFDTATGVTANYQSRARWCWNGDPTDATKWADDAIGLGNYNDAPTTERIITAKFIKDTLVVGFERSTWALKYTGNETLPFIWERVDVDLGCESTHSSVVFDNFMLQVGDKGISAANAYNVERIDLKVPNLVTEIHNDLSGQERVHGIRDFNWQMVYWTYPTGAFDKLGGASPYRKIYPDSVIAYNYYEQAFSTYDASFTCFGRYQPANDLMWQDCTDRNWASFNAFWNSGQIQSMYPSIVAGNQVGFVHKIEDVLSNSVSVYITNVTLTNPCVVTAPNHNFQDGQCIKITSVIGTTELNNNIYFVTACNTNTFQLQYLQTNPLSPFYGQRVLLNATAYTPYSGYGLIRTIDNFDIWTKQYNQFQADDVKVRFGVTEIFMTVTDKGYCNLNVYIDQNQDDPIANFTIPSTIQTQPLPPLPPISSGKYWEKVFVNSVGNYIQLELNFNDFQMIDEAINTSDIEISAFNFKVAVSGQRSSFS